jgi:hypothetical protein
MTLVLPLFDIQYASAPAPLSVLRLQGCLNVCTVHAGDVLFCRDQEEWLSAALFPGKNDRTQNVSYETQAEKLKRTLGELDLVFSKLTHIFRVGGARHLDSAGMDDTVRARGRAGTGEGWNRNKERGSTIAFHFLCNQHQCRTVLCTHRRNVATLRPRAALLQLILYDVDLNLACVFLPMSFSKQPKIVVTSVAMMFVTACQDFHAMGQQPG